MALDLSVDQTLEPTNRIEAITVRMSHHESRDHSGFATMTLDVEIEAKKESL